MSVSGPPLCGFWFGVPRPLSWMVSELDDVRALSLLCLG